jgi:Cu(I)/Ag(I) efflux system membrane fusion protein
MKKVLFLFAAIIMMTANSACSNQKQTAQKVEETQATLAVQGNCEMCKERIETAAKGIEGVASAAWDAEAHQLQIQFDAAKTSVEAVSKAVAGVGYDTEKDQAPDEVYNALPPCCKYR